MWHVLFYPGTTLKYTIIARNTGTVKLRGLAIVPVVPNISNSANITCVDTSTNTTWDSYTLPVGRQLACTGSLTVTQTDIEAGSLDLLMNVTAAKHSC